MAPAAPHTCDKLGITQCLRKVIPFANATSIADTPEGLEEECLRMRQGIKCLVGYVDAGCLVGNDLIVFRLLLSGVASETALRCQRGTTRYDEHFTYVQCENRAGEQINTCMRKIFKYMDAVVASGRNLDHTDTPYGFECLAKCIAVAVTEKCPEQPGAASYARGVVEGIANELCDFKQLESGYCGRSSERDLGFCSLFELMTHEW